jgi:hypothetical protein
MKLHQTLRFHYGAMGRQFTDTEGSFDQMIEGVCSNIQNIV